jgi:protein TonB
VRGGKLSVFGASFALHAAAAAILAWIAVDRVSRDPEPTFTDFELIDTVPRAPEPPVLVEPPPLPPPPPPEPAQRPEVVPETARVARVDEARPFAPQLEQSGNREAPDDVEAVQAPETTLVFDMQSEVGGGSGDYVSTSVGGTVAVAPGGRGGGDGQGGGAPGAVDRPGRTDLRVARDWQVTALPQPVNDRDFEPDYPPLARREGREATVVVELAIDVAGRVATAEVVRGPRGHGFRRSALAYARKLRFKPAQAGSRPVASRIEWTVYFYARN